jgi:adenine-specific DNA-methyltransferase
MATGVTKAERAGTNRVAHDADVEPLALPPASASVHLSYPCNSCEAEILSVAPGPFAAMGMQGDGRCAQADAKIAPNALVWGDNFLASLKLLQSHAGQVSLVYMDPPYCTGMDFQSRSQRHAYSDQLAPSQYVEFMRRRFILCRELLSDSGSLYCHIGHQMLGHLKVVLDEVFGADNFRNLIVRRKCSSKNYTRRQLPNIHDYILFYTKTGNYIWNRPTAPASDEWIRREYPKVDGRGRRYKLVPIHAPGVRNGACGKPWRNMVPPPGKHWQHTPHRLEKLDGAGEIHWSKNGNPRRKVFLEGAKELALTDYWAAFRDAHHQSIAITGYPTEKNLDLLKTIVAASSEPGSIVLDPFCGSGTTLDAAEQLGRRWVGFDSSLAAIEASVRRFRRGVSRMGDYVVRAGAPMTAPLESAVDHPIADALSAETCRAVEFTLFSDARLLQEHEAEVAVVAGMERGERAAGDQRGCALKNAQIASVASSDSLG